MISSPFGFRLFYIHGSKDCKNSILPVIELFFSNFLALNFLSFVSYHLLFVVLLSLEVKDSFGTKLQDLSKEGDDMDI